MKLPRLPRSITVLHAKYTAEQMKVYAKKCVELEREACANMCELFGSTLANGEMLAQAIRERGQG